MPLATVVAACALRLVVVAELHDHPLLQPDAGLDTTAYVTLARRVLSGDPGLGPGLYYVSPLYIYFLAAAWGLLGSFTAVRVVQALLGAATVFCVWTMARRWGSPRAGAIAAILAAGCGVLAFHEVVLMQSALDGILTAAALTALTLALSRAPDVAPTRGGARRAFSATDAWLLAAGAIFGLQTLNRPNVLAGVVAVGLALLQHRRLRAGVLLAAGVFAALLPVAARNVVVAGQWSLVSSHGGLNFYIGNHAGATGLYDPVPGIRPEIEGQIEDTRRVAEAATGRRLSDAEVSDYFFARGTQWIREEPAAAARLFLRKLALAFHGDHLALPHSYAFFAGDARTLLRGLVLNPWFVMPLGLAGLVGAAPRDRRREFLVWAAFVPGYAAGLALFFVAERYRIPLFVPLYVGAGLLIDRALAIVRTPRAWRVHRTWIAGATAAVVLAFALVNWPFALADSREGDRLRMVVFEAGRGRFDEAERWAARAIEDSTRPADVRARAGAILLRADEPARARPYLEAAYAAYGGRRADLAVDLADARHRVGDPDGARAALAALDPATIDDARLLVRAGRIAGLAKDAALAAGLFEAAVRAAPTLADGWAQLGFTRLAQGRLADAERALREATRLAPADALALGGLSACVLNQGRLEEARTHALAALALDPAEPVARQVLEAIGRAAPTGPGARRSRR